MSIVQRSAVVTCGVRGEDMSSRYLEVYSYQHSARYFSVTQDESDYKNKVLRDTRGYTPCANHPLDGYC